MRIPFETLRFQRTEQPVWGVNFRRYIARKNEEDLWYAFSRNEGVFKISKAGELQGIRLTETKSQLSVKPYLLAGVEYTPPESPNSECDAELDILDTKYGLLSSLRVRGFSALARCSAVRHFTQEEQVFPRKAENFTVLRFKKEVLRSSCIGCILANRSSRSRYALTLRIDFLDTTTNFLGNKNLYIDGYFMMSSKDKWHNRREASAYTFSVDYPNDLIDTHIVHSYRGQDFDPEVGFVRRTGVQSCYGHFRIAPRIERRGIKMPSFMVSSHNLYDVEG